MLLGVKFGVLALSCGPVNGESHVDLPAKAANACACPELARSSDRALRRLAFANFSTLNFGVLSPVPSGEIAFALGSTLRPRQRRRGGEWYSALGYQFAVSVGGADYTTAFLSYGGGTGVFFHRHHLISFGYGGKKRNRLFYSLGGGIVMWLTHVAALEAEGRLGYVFFRQEKSRIQGMVGGQARITGFLDGIPLPEFGAFIGWMVF